MIHLTDTSANLLTVMGSIRLVVETSRTELRSSLSITDEGVSHPELLQAILKSISITALERHSRLSVVTPDQLATTDSLVRGRETRLLLRSHGKPPRLSCSSGAGLQTSFLEAFMPSWTARDVPRVDYDGLK